MYNLALSDETKLEIAQSDVLTPLISLASPDIEVSRQAVGLANIAEDVETSHDGLRASNALLSLLMRSRHLDVHRELPVQLQTCSAQKIMLFFGRVV